jgi:hypothetical protein
MGEADRLLYTILEARNLVGHDAAGRIVVQLAVEPAIQAADDRYRPV